MKSPKSKADSLVAEFLPKMYCYTVDGKLDENITIRNAKECAHIVCDEIINHYYDAHYESDGHYEYKDIRDYWQEVRQEIIIL